MQKHPTASVCISKEAQVSIAHDVGQRAAIEACGLLIGSMDTEGHWHVQHAHPLPNVYASPIYFEFAPEDLLEAELTYPDQIVGVYHSHPTGFAIASETDMNNMRRVNAEERIPWVWLIISGPFSEKAAQIVERPMGGTSIIAYHHYEEGGLQEIQIHLEPADVS